MPGSAYYIETNINEILRACQNQAEAALVGLKKGLKKAGIIVETKAKSYFSSGGPGGSWPRLKESTRRIKASKGKDRGILKETTGLLHSITTQQSGFITLVGTSKKYAAYHEYGAPRANIPQRSFLRPAAKESENELKEAILDAIKEEAKL